MSTARYPVTDTNPISIYPGGKQGEVTIYNDSDNSVYVSDTASDIYSIPVGGRQSIAWNAQTPLYAMVQDITKPAAVLVIDSGVTLPTGVVNVSGGSLNIGTIGAPVNVQGGGTLLTSGTANISALGSVTVTIPLPANGLTYYGLRITLSNSGPGSPGSIVQWGSDLLPAGSLAGPPTGTNALGLPWQTTFFTPVIGAFPIPLFLREVAGIATQVNYDVRGISTGPVVAVTDLVPNLRPDSNEIVVPAGAAPVVYIPPSYDPYMVYLRTGGASTINDMNVQECLSGAWYTTQISPVGGVTAGTFVAFAMTGSGFATKLNFVTVAGGAVYAGIKKGISHV